MSLRVVLLVLATSAGFAAETESQRIDRYLAYGALIRLTGEKIDVVEQTSGMCRDPRDIHGSHLKPGIHLYATKAVIDTRAKSESPRYPVGALLVKEKFEARGDSKPSVITVMEKIANEGRIDDWRFTMVRVSDRAIVKDGFRLSCVDCHQRYSKLDFVSSVTHEILAGHAQGKPAAPSTR